MLFIKVENNQTVDHPVTIENLRMIYPDFDITDPPGGYMPFNRASVPVSQGPYEVHRAEYVINGNVVNEVYQTRQMADDEKQQLWDSMINSKPYNSWVLNKETCIWEPPVPYPSTGEKYQWNEETQTWLSEQPQPEVPVIEVTKIEPASN